MKDALEFTVGPDCENETKLERAYASTDKHTVQRVPNEI